MLLPTTLVGSYAQPEWLSNEPSRISPRSWKNTARVSLLPASPLFSPARQRSRNAGLEYHSIMNRVRSIRPISRSARDNVFDFGRAASFSGESRAQ